MGLQSLGWNIVQNACGWMAGTDDQIGVSAGLGALQSNGAPRRRWPTGDQSTDVGAYEVQAPINTTSPSISGTPTVGQALTCGHGSWSTDHVTPTYGYTWTSDGTTVATTSQYTWRSPTRGISWCASSPRTTAPSR
jgi:hypothetical protein